MIRRSASLAAVAVCLIAAGARAVPKPPSSQPGVPEAWLKTLDAVLHEGPFKKIKDTQWARADSLKAISIVPDAQASPPDADVSSAEKQAFVAQMSGMLRAFHADPTAVARYLIDTNLEHPLPDDRLELLDHLLAGQVTTLIHGVRGSSR